MLALIGVHTAIHLTQRPYFKQNKNKNQRFQNHTSNSLSSSLWTARGVETGAVNRSVCSANLFLNVNKCLGGQVGASARGLSAGFRSQRKKPTQARGARERPLCPAAYRVHRMLRDTWGSEKQGQTLSSGNAWNSFSSLMARTKVLPGSTVMDWSQTVFIFFVFFFSLPFFRVLSSLWRLLHTRGRGEGGAFHTGHMSFSSSSSFFSPDFLFQNSSRVNCAKV